MSTILVTGGSGYIGSHTIVDLIDNGYNVISVDNNSRSNPAMLEGVERITGKKVKNYKVDLCNFDDTFAIFQENEDIEGIIHFAAFKSVGESVEKPLMYFENNLNSLINLLKCVQEFKTPYFVFSSSCTVYGNPDQIPVTEQTPPSPLSHLMVTRNKWVSRSLMNLRKAAVPSVFCCVISTRLAHILLYLLVRCLLGSRKTWCLPLRKPL